MVSEAIAGGNVQAINYFVANNYMKALEAIAKSPNQKILMMPLEASSVIGSLAGLAEITSEAFGKERRRANSRAARRVACREPDANVCCFLSLAGPGSPSMSLSNLFAGFGHGTGSSWLCCCSSWRPSCPGVHFLWFGVAAVLVGLLALATGFAWQWQLIAFGVISVADRVSGCAATHGRTPPRAICPISTSAAQQYIGRTRDRRAGDPERPRQGARRRYSVAGRRCGRCGRRARQGQECQRHSAGRGA